ncbi:hypothetical protein E0Z10_g3269 [Xylaria hypoxylon]|uniref:Prolyl 4-hydroxylase alpha subunit Fe(2+) 2OG dioxygenase domain-containing protein n=1 Tax=Xylaria hypoxylon TaxID=37992 RepID=A0A4Z0YP20_9PEZI|nr:hypothetical protein E0Z10_g3269 [Xylaria hypoxylon]
MKTYPLGPNPGLCVKSTLIPLPLTYISATLIKELSEPVTLDNKSQNATPNTWELSTDQFDLLNPAWPSFLNTILDDVCTRLGVTKSVDAKLHKLILHGQGSFSQSQDAPPKEQSEIATLLVYLPSNFNGGKLRLSYAGQSRMCNVAEGSPFNTTALVWPSCVAHEIDELISGHQLVLSYNIISRLESHGSTDLFDQQVTNIHRALLQCHRQSADFSTKAYLLDHKYLPTELSLHQLKDRDRTVCETLKRLCSRHGLFIFIGHCTKEACTDWGSNTRKDYLHLKHLNGLDGTKIGAYHLLPEEQLLNNSRDGIKRTEGFLAFDQAQRNVQNYDTRSMRLTPTKRAAMGRADAMNAVAQIINDDALEENDMTSIRWEKYFGETIGQIIGQVESVDDFSSCLDTIQNTIRVDLQPSFGSWRAAIEQYALENKATLGIQDDRSIIRQIISNIENPSWVTWCLIPALRERGDTMLIRSLVGALLSNVTIDNPTTAKDIAGKILRGTNWKGALQPEDIPRAVWVTGFLRFLEQCLKADPKYLGIKLLDASWTRIAARHRSLNDLPLIQQQPSITRFLKLLAQALKDHDVPYIHSTKELFKLFICRYLHIGVPLWPRKRLDQRDDILEHEMNIYNKNVSRFEAPFKELRCNYIKDLLGERDYRELIMLERVTNSEGSDELAALDTLNVSTTNRWMKRSADTTGTTSNERTKKRRGKT